MKPREGVVFGVMEQWERDALKAAYKAGLTVECYRNSSGWTRRGHGLTTWDDGLAFRLKRVNAEKEEAMDRLAALEVELKAARVAVEAMS